jgi:RNA polymerase sigma factor (sigma-70 family)
MRTSANAEGGDQRLVAAAIRGEQSAWALLVKVNTEAVWRLAYSLLCDSQAAGDIVNETFLKAQQALEQYGGDRSFRSWLLRICRNCCIDENRRHARRRTEMPIESLDQPTATTSRRHSPSAVGAGSANSEEEWAMRLALAWALAQLSEQEREAFLLVKGMQLTSNQAAEIAGVAPTTMRSRIGRAKAKLAWLLEDGR